MSIDAALSGAVSGLAAVQRQMDVASRNISNANTAGYTRKYVRTETVIVAGEATGVRTGGLQRSVDQALTRQLLQEEANTSYHRTTEAFLARIEAVHGRPDAAMSLGNVVARLRDDFVKLVDSPESTELQLQAIDSARDTARTLNTLSQELSQARTDIQSEISREVERLNGLLSRIRELNLEIKRSASHGSPAPDLEDHRDQALRELGVLVEIRTYQKGDGSVAVLTRTGQPMLEDRAESFAASKATLDASSSYPDSIPGIRQRPLDPSQPWPDVTGWFDGGKIGALIELRDRILPMQQAQLDEFAAVMARAFDAIGIPTTDPPDGNSSASLRLFTDAAGSADPPSTPGFAASIRVNAAILEDPAKIRDGTAVDGNGDPIRPNPAVSGTNGLLRAVLDGVFETELTFATSGLGPRADLSSNLPGRARLTAYASEIVSIQGTTRAQYTQRSEDAEALRDHLQQKLLDRSGVNLDRELAELVQLQRSYASISRIIATGRDMFQDLLNAVR